MSFVVMTSVQQPNVCATSLVNHAGNCQQGFYSHTNEMVCNQELPSLLKSNDNCICGKLNLKLCVKVLNPTLLRCHTQVYCCNFVSRSLFICIPIHWILRKGFYSHLWPSLIRTNGDKYISLSILGPSSIVPSYYMYI